jgi:hypothetical protein
MGIVRNQRKNSISLYIGMAGAIKKLIIEVRKKISK